MFYFPISFAIYIGMVFLCFCYFLMFKYKSSSILYEWQFFDYLNFQCYFDKYSTTFIAIVLHISMAVLFFTSSYMYNDPKLKYFVFMLSMFIMSMLALIVVPHLIFLMIGWDGLGVSSFMLVIYYMNEKSFFSGLITLLTNRVGDCMLILCCSWSLSSMNWSFLMSYKFNWLMLIFIVLGSLTKSAQLPFSSWLPAAMAAPTPVSALVHSSTLVTAGVYLLVRFYSLLSSFMYFNSLLLMLGMMTCLMAGMSAFFETDLKKIIALSTLSQLGVMFITLGLQQPAVCFFHLLTHAMFKALLFVCAGSIIHSYGDVQDIRLLGNIYSTMPLTTITMNIANMSLCGIPVLSGFYSKDMIIESFFMEHYPLSTSFIVFFSMVLTSAYTIRLSYFTLWNSYKGQPLMSVNEESEATIICYLFLVVGAIMGSFLISAKLRVSLYTLVLPMTFKFSTLIFIMILGVMSFYTTKHSMKMPFLDYMLSLSYLNYMNSFFVNKVFLLTINKLVMSEMYWMEKMSSLGMKEILSKVQNKTQIYFFSNWITMIFMIFLFLMIMLIL